ncbi:uncharacterized protein [Dermacentor albipictus]|uniref:uncharacterized protein n=1 Tax=Dermacentor albipictus TaxID=60249 RepID=UPI0038FBE661
MQVRPRLCALCTLFRSSFCDKRFQHQRSRRMSPGWKPSDSALGFDAATKLHGHICLPNMRRLILVVLYGAAGLLATLYTTSTVARLVTPLSPNGFPESSAPATPPAEALSDLNWTACPAGKDITAELHFRLWDDKLAHALRLSAKVLPRAENESWHAVTEHIHVFSAFVAADERRKIIISSLVRSHAPKCNGTPIQHPPLQCIIRTSNETITHKAYIRMMWTYFNPSFKNAVITCRSPNGTSPAGDYVQVAIAATASNATSLRWLKLHYQPKESTGTCCAVCVRPLFGAVSLWKIVEFIAHYRVVGARTFYFYDLNMNADLKLLVAWMQSMGVDLTLVPFKLIVDTTVENEHVQAHGQMPALYDCIFRSLSKTEYYVHVDIDELMVALPNFSIPAFLRNAQRKSEVSFGSFVLPSRFHCAEYPRNLRHSSYKLLPLQTRLFAYHTVYMSDDGVTKYIARSRTVCEPAVHQVKKHCGPAAKYLLDSSQAFIKHYRPCCDLGRSSYHAEVSKLWTVALVSADSSFTELSARIEDEAITKALRRLIAYTNSAWL